MATTGPTSPADTGVLLEAGTNEVEILVFRVGDQRFGVNVAKVREVRNTERVLHLPRYPEAVLGVIQIRGAVVPLVDLRKFLGGYDEDQQHDDQQADLLLEYNDRLVAFRVQGIDRVFRVSWKDLMPLPKCPGMQAPVTGIILLEGGIITLLDFESIGAVLGVNGDVHLKRQDTSTDPVQRSERPLVYVDDSPLIRRMLEDALTAGRILQYPGLHGRAGGLGILGADRSRISGRSELANGSVASFPTSKCPAWMDSILPRESGRMPHCKTVPVVLFSSLISKDNEKKGKQVGATAQVSKPRWEDLASTLTQLLDQVIAG